MTNYQRPWWLWVNKPGRVNSTVREEATADGQRYTIRGEPLVQSLTWLIWGPVAALLVIFTITALAIVFEAREQSLLVRAIFVVAFLGLPIVAWIAAIVVSNRLSAKYLQAERDAETQECQIRLNTREGALHYQSKNSSKETVFDFRHIRQVKVSEPIGARDSHSVCLILDTHRGKVMLLDESLGTEAQKFDLAQEIQEAMQRHLEIKNSP